MDWYKKAQKVRWFNWDLGSGDIWTITYRDIEPSEMYDNGQALSDRAIMGKMIVSIQNKYGDLSLSRKQIEYFLDKFMSKDEFFDKVQETNNKFKEEEKIEQRDIDSGLIDLDYDLE